MNFCSRTAGIFELIGNVLKIFLLFIPLIIIVYAIFDYFKSVVSKEEKEMGKATKRVILRIVSGMLIFFLPPIINFIFAAIGVSESDCLKCMLDTSTCSAIKSGSSTDTNIDKDLITENADNEECTVEDEDCISDAIYNESE